VTGDGRFTVEQSSNGWMVVDAEQANELGLPLVAVRPRPSRGPDGLEHARHGPALSSLADRIAAQRDRSATDQGRQRDTKQPP
jgi:hypothetical protein